MRNLASSSMPSKLDLQALILDQDLVKKFNLDARKFSRNYETSILFDQYNTGESIQLEAIRTFFNEWLFLQQSDWKAT